MFKMFGYMKKNIVWIILIVVLLFLQAFCDLSLPEYTSKIVDTGIQQQGIEDAVPDTIRPEMLQIMLAFSEPSEQAAIADAYDFPAGIKENGVYAVKDLTEEERADVNDILAEKECVLVMLAQAGVSPDMPQEQIMAAYGQVMQKMDQYPDLIKNQMAIAFVQQEYVAQGIDMGEYQTNYLWGAAGRMLLMAGLACVCAIVVTFFASRIAAQLAMDLRNKVYRKVLTFSSNEMNKFSTASLITRSTNDIQQVQMVMVMILRIVIFAPILAIGGILKVSQTGSYLSWILILGIAVLLGVMVILFGTVMPKFKRLQSLIDKVNLVSREILTGIPVIRAFSTQKHEEKRFEKANKDLTKTNLFVNRVMVAMMPVMMLLMNAIVVLIIYNGAQGVDQGALQVGDMMAFIQYAMQIIMSFLLISAISIFLPRASVSAKRIQEILDTETIIKEPKNPVKPAEDVKGKIEFKNVSFAYPGAEEETLSDINFTAYKGQTIAFIGSTGSGKSSLINLIPRFYDVTKGQVLIDDVDVRDMDIHDLRSRIGYVPQKSVLFSGTIDSNTRFGNPDGSEEEIRKAIEVAQAAEFVDAKPDGMDSSIAQGGSNVSGGQKQRLSIARAIAKNPEIYIFDDSFSALDFATDSKLRQALKKETADVTSLIVAQRVSTIMHADLIIVLDEGRVVGEGTHEELLKNNEVYKQIASSQLSEKELGQ